MTAELEVRAALAVLRDYPAPILSWRLQVALGRLEERRGDPAAALSTYAEASAIVGSIATHVGDERLRSAFLASQSVAELRTSEFRKS